MTTAWVPPPLPRGAAPVGQLSELPVLELGAILLLRQWCDGDLGRIRIAEDLAQVLDAAATAKAVNDLGHLLTLLTQHARRPLMRHGVQCGCFGGDEALFAHLVAAATAGDSEDAMAFALTLLPPAMAWEAVQSAAPVGRAILCLARRTPVQPTPTRH